MGMVKEFKEFAMRGNVVDMAVGIIIGAAFGKIVTSLVNDVLMPPIGALLGGVDFASLAVKVKEATVDAAGKTSPAVIISYGKFINTILDFIIVAFCIFMVVKVMNALKTPAPAAAPTTKECPRCFSAIPIKASRCPQCTSDVK